jgi:2-iminobutanoate/2-iminopropanoate deaminase
MARIAGNAAPVAPPQGPYSASVRIGSLVAVAGQCGYLSDGSLVDGLEEQTRMSMRNVEAALRASGASMSDVLSVQVFLTDEEHFARMNAVYAEFFTAPYPARTTVYVGLRGDVLVEVSAIAATTPELETT